MRSITDISCSSNLFSKRSKQQIAYLLISAPFTSCHIGPNGSKYDAGETHLWQCIFRLRQWELSNSSQLQPRYLHLPFFKIKMTSNLKWVSFSLSFRFSMHHRNKHSLPKLKIIRIFSLVSRTYSNQEANFKELCFLLVKFVLRFRSL